MLKKELSQIRGRAPPLADSFIFSPQVRSVCIFNNIFYFSISISLIFLFSLSRVGVNKYIPLESQGQKKSSQFLK